jgi:hypothetical protein
MGQPNSLEAAGLAGQRAAQAACDWLDAKLAPIEEHIAAVRARIGEPKPREKPELRLVVDNDGGDRG